MARPEKYEPVLEEEQFEELHRMANLKKSTVRVDRQALFNLLMDHANLWERLGIQ